MNDKLKNFIVRTLTGIVYVVLLVGCTVFSPVTSFIFFSLVAEATIVEFSHIMNKNAGANIPTPINALSGFLLCSTLWLWNISAGSAMEMAALYGFSLLYIIISELYRKESNPLKNWALAFASQIYVATPFALLPIISIVYDTEGQIQYTWIYVLSLFIFLWASDSGAYLVGSLLGRYFKAKLFPRISPNKSWVGSIGGGLLAVGISQLLAIYDPEALGRWEWAGFALVVVVFGTWGDLVESLLKRQLGIKDSGKILPGHGGLLDRFDSALLAIPAVVIYLTALKYMIG